MLAYNANNLCAYNVFNMMCVNHACVAMLHDCILQGFWIFSNAYD